MTLHYKVPTSWMDRIWFPLFVLSQVMLIRSSRFHIDSGFPWGFGGGWFITSWWVVLVLASIWWIRGLLTSSYVVVEGDVISIHSKIGPKLSTEEVVTTVTDDQLKFYLYSKSAQLGLSKKRTPEQLVGLLDQHISKAW